jgi:hypothetical protein
MVVQVPARRNGEPNRLQAAKVEIDPFTNEVIVFHDPEGKSRTKFKLRGFGAKKLVIEDPLEMMAGHVEVDVSRASAPVPPRHLRSVPDQPA